MTEAAGWCEVSAQLATLQTEMARLTETLTEDRKQRQASRWAWVLAALVLCCSGSLVFIGIRVGLTGSTASAEASSLQTQAHTDLARGKQAIEQVVRPVIILAKRHGVAWLNHHSYETNVSAMNAAARWGARYEVASASATNSQRSADRLELTGPALLTFGSALAGAVLG